jgi:hypothetical protein
MDAKAKVLKFLKDLPKGTVLKVVNGTLLASAGTAVTMLAGPEVTAIIALLTLLPYGGGAVQNLIDWLDDGLSDTYENFQIRFNKAKEETEKLKKKVNQIKPKISRFNTASDQAQKDILVSISNIFDGVTVNSISEANNLLANAQKELDASENNLKKYASELLNQILNKTEEYNNFLHKKVPKLFKTDFQLEFLNKTGIDLKYLDITNINEINDIVNKKIDYAQSVIGNVNATTEERNQAKDALKYLEEFSANFNKVKNEAGKYTNNPILNPKPNPTQSETQANKTQEATAQATEDTGKNLQLSKDVLSLSNENLGVTSKLLGAGSQSNKNEEKRVSSDSKLVESSGQSSGQYIRAYPATESDLGSDGVQSAAFSDATPTGYITTKSLRYIGITH